MLGCSVVGTMKKAILSHNIYNLKNNVMFYYRVFHPSVAMNFSLLLFFFVLFGLYFVCFPGCLLVVSAFWFLCFHSWMTWASISWRLQFFFFAHSQQSKDARIELSIAHLRTSKELHCCIHTRKVLWSTFGPPRESPVAPGLVSLGPCLALQFMLQTPSEGQEDVCFLSQQGQDNKVLVIQYPD